MIFKSHGMKTEDGKPLQIFRYKDFWNLQMGDQICLWYTEHSSSTPIHSARLRATLAGSHHCHKTQFLKHCCQYRSTRKRCLHVKWKKKRYLQITNKIISPHHETYCLFLLSNSQQDKAIAPSQDFFTQKFPGTKSSTSGVYLLNKKAHTSVNVISQL